MTTADLIKHQNPLRWTEKAILVASLSACAALFLSIGWQVMAPEDPHGAVSLWAHSSFFAMFIQAVALTVVATAIATAMIGTRIPDIGIFAACLGLAMVTLKGDTAEYLLINIAEGNQSAEKMLAGQLAIESILWCVLVLLAMITSGAALHWCFGINGQTHNDAPKTVQDNKGISLMNLAISDCPFLSKPLGIQPVKFLKNSAADDWAGAKTTAITTVVSAFVFTVFIAPSSPRSIQHGQTWFAVFAAFYIGVWASKRFASCRTPFWSLLAIPATSVLGYIWTMLQGELPARYANLANIPASAFLRALPLTFVSVAAMGVLFAFWTVAEPQRKPKKEKPTQKSRRSRRR